MHYYDLLRLVSKSHACHAIEHAVREQVVRTAQPIVLEAFPYAVDDRHDVDSAALA